MKVSTVKLDPQKE